MDKRKLILIIIVLLIIAIILTLIIIKNSKSKYGNEIEKNQDESNVVINYEYEKVDNATLFYTVSDCIQNYFDYISIDINSDSTNKTYIDKKTELGIETEEEKKQLIYNTLDKDYISKNNVTLDNIYNFTDQINEEITFTAIKMNMLDGERIQRFVAHGMIRGQLENQYIYIIVNLDSYNLTYSIEPVMNNTYSNINEIKLEERTQEITTNENNEFEYNRISEENIIREYLSFYKTSAINNPEQAYELLDKEYREKKFGSVEEYKTYVANNKEMIANSVLDSYQIKEDGENTRYICIDQNGNYYIFNETAIMDYTVILDTYTVDLPEFRGIYYTATEQQKVALNIDKFMQAINAKDYKYAYSCLADSYKNNYFKTQEEFEIYAKENFYINSRVEYKEFNIESNLYTYSVVLIDKTTGEQKTKTFVMQLGEGTEFVLSFDR